MKGKMKAEDVVAHFSRIAEDYEYHPEDIFREDTPRVEALKRILDELDVVDRNIIILYSEMQSTRELAKVLHVSDRTAAYEVERVKKIILAKYAVKSKFQM